MGTGIVTGPYSISSGQTLGLNDPATWSIASGSVQIQNNTGYTVFIQSAGAGYNIQPFTCSTIPAAGGQTLVAVVSSTANLGLGLLTAVWLLPGQTGPMQDGPMTVFPRTQHFLTVNTNGSGQYSFSGFNPGDTLVIVTYSASVIAPPSNYLWLGQVNYALTPYYGPSTQIINNTTQTATFSITPVSAPSLSLAFLFGTTSAPNGYVALGSGITGITAIAST